MQIKKEDFNIHKKDFDDNDEIGFFHFNIMEYKLNDNSLKISYFSDVYFEQKFQGCKLFDVILNTYNKVLNELNVDLDYLHVRSDLSFTASLYKKRNYNFTPATLEIINEYFGGELNYLQNSSVSQGSKHTIEMYRSLSNKIQVANSIEKLEDELKKYD